MKGKTSQAYQSQIARPGPGHSPRLFWPHYTLPRGILSCAHFEDKFSDPRNEAARHNCILQGKHRYNCTKAHLYNPDRLGWAGLSRRWSETAIPFLSRGPIHTSSATIPSGDYFLFVPWNLVCEPELTPKEPPKRGESNHYQKRGLVGGKTPVLNRPKASFNALGGAGGQSLDTN